MINNSFFLGFEHPKDSSKLLLHAGPIVNNQVHVSVFSLTLEQAENLLGNLQEKVRELQEETNGKEIDSVS